jgi:hypothetical protein
MTKSPTLAALTVCLAAAAGTFAQSPPAPAPGIQPHQLQELEGWKLHIHPNLLQQSPRETGTALTLLREQLAQINKLVPAPALERLHKIGLWMNPPYPDQRAPRAEYHPNPGWLAANQRDPAMAKCVEFTNVAIFEAENRRMPMFALHELAHGYHDQVLGNRNPEVLAAFEKAKAGGVYGRVKRWTGERIVQDKAYALSSPQEYFAETTEAFFGRNDFEPFDRAELKRMDPGMEALLAKLWGAAP